MTKARKKPPVAEFNALRGRPVADGSDVMKLPEAAAYVGCHPDTLKKLAKEGKAPSFRLGTGWRFSRKALDEWIEKENAKSGKKGKDDAA